MGTDNVSDPTVAHLIKMAQSREIDLLLHPGDQSYSDGVAARWDEYGRKCQPFAAFVPTLFQMGNHEALFKNGLQYRARYFNPRPATVSADATWWSIDLDYTHIVGLDGESTVDTPYISPEQAAWLERDLAAVDRTATPFVIVIIHRPLYCTSSHTECVVYPPILRDAVEKSLVKHGVDLVITGHRHNCKFANCTCSKL